ncbi:HET-domain-containing protein [Ophiobolus disseminans]|uniref:HET-domain-containing protein n=1 Tax=Ophiobolus disseminans TaxID=1469910 RepID=A0A6A7A7Y2_9PLEO|nr:HET-domain-containing protein [Ophiobolus disseminans]
MDSAASCHHCETVKIEDNWFGHKGTARELSYRQCAELFHTECATCPPSNDQTLCAACRHLKLYHLLFCNPQWWIIPLGTIEDMKAAQPCAFHRLLLLAAQAFIETLNISEVAAQTLPFRLSAFLRSPREHEAASLRLEVPLEGFYDMSNTLTVHRLLGSAEAPPFAEQCLVPNHINWEQLMHWSTTCANSHSHLSPSLSSDEPIGDLPRAFRVVDVLERCVTRLPAASPFVALSYVWGTQSVDSQSTSRMETITAYEQVGGLAAAHLPSVINDAMEICLQLKERYLWVDRLCIVQDDPKDKEEQIHSMGDVFAMATFTLVIACGNDMSVQLPGVSIERHVSTGYADFDALHVRSRLPSLLDTIKAATWYSRGWTYQEGILAGRQLFITAMQAMWMCPKGIFYEDTSMNTTYGLLETVDYSKCLKEMQLTSTTSLLEAYKTHSSSYNARHLSYVSDIYDAFNGIGKALYGSWELFDDHVYGLPIMDFDAVLLWYPAKTSLHKARRSEQVNLPSWSWVSVCGALRYLPFSGSLVKWQLAAADHDGQITRRALDAYQSSSFLAMDSDRSRPWHNPKKVFYGDRDEPASYDTSSCHSMVLALSHDCLDSVICDEVREMQEDLSAAEFDDAIQQRWPDYSYYYDEAIVYGTAPITNKPVPATRLLILETRAQVAVVAIAQHGPHDIKRCRFDEDSSWWNILGPDRRCIGLTRPIPLLRGPLSNGQGGTRRVTVMALSVGTLDWWRDDCLEFHQDTNEQFGSATENYCTEPQAHGHPGDEGCNFEHRAPGLHAPPVPAINVLLIVWGECVWRRVSVGCILLTDWAKLDRYFEDIQLC